MQDNPNSLKWEHIDIAGIALSFICGIHCVILPLALVMLPSVGWSIHSNHSFETIMVILIIALAATVLVKGYLNHGRWQVILFLAFGAVIFLLVRPALGNSMHAYTSVIGGTSFIIGHLYNWNWCRTCPVCRASNAVCEVSLNKNLGK
jgi:hypothetical protein